MFSRSLPSTSGVQGCSVNSSRITRTHWPSLVLSLVLSHSRTFPKLMRESQANELQLQLFCEVARRGRPGETRPSQPSHTKKSGDVFSQQNVTGSDIGQFQVKAVKSGCTLCRLSVSSLDPGWIEKDSGKDLEALGDARATRWERPSSRVSVRQVAHRASARTVLQEIHLYWLKQLGCCGCLLQKRDKPDPCRFLGGCGGTVKETVSKHGNCFLLKLWDTLGPSNSAVGPFTTM